MKTIWIINQYASDPKSGASGRHHYIARALAERGHRVYVIAASWHHLLNDTAKEKNQACTTAEYGYQFVRLGVPSYGSAHAKGRIRNWFLFRRRLWAMRKSLPAPDVVLYSSPSLIGFPVAAKLSKHFKAKLAFEVRDIWPLTLVELGGLSAFNPIIRYMQHIEDRAYRLCDVALSNLSHVESHMREHGLAPGRFHYIPNGVDLAEVAQPDPLSADVRAQIPKGKFIIGYTGTLGLANKSNVLLEAAEILKDDPEVAILFVGGGREKSDLQHRAAASKLENVTFIGPIPKAQIQSMLRECDSCYIGASRSPLYQFGVAANKIYDYLYAGRPIILSYSGAGDPATAYSAGLVVPAESPQELADAIRQLKSLPLADRQQMGQNGHQAALKHHNYDAIAQKLEAVLFGNLKRCDS